MSKRMKNGLLLMIVLVLGLVAGVSLGVVVEPVQSAAAPTATGVSRPVPPQIEVWGVPDPDGGEPAECVGQPGCGVLCYYIAENAVENQHELSCMAWIFE